MKQFNKVCKECNTEFIGLGPATKYCELCKPGILAEASKRNSYSHKLRRGLIQNPGVGKGGGNSAGVEDTQYKSGIAYFMKNRRRVKEERRFCERCSKDLVEATRYFWVIHHRDHDRTNNEDFNFELLCKKCHQKEHDCHLAFSKTCND